MIGAASITRSSSPSTGQVPSPRTRDGGRHLARIEQRDEWRRRCRAARGPRQRLPERLVAARHQGGRSVLDRDDGLHGAPAVGLGADAPQLDRFRRRTNPTPSARTQLPILAAGRAGFSWAPRQREQRRQEDRAPSTPRPGTHRTPSTSTSGPARRRPRPTDVAPACAARQPSRSRIDDALTAVASAHPSASAWREQDPTATDRFLGDGTVRVEDVALVEHRRRQRAASGDRSRCAISGFFEGRSMTRSTWRARAARNRSSVEGRG